MYQIHQNTNQLSSEHCFRPTFFNHCRYWIFPVSIEEFIFYFLLMIDGWNCVQQLDCAFHRLELGKLLGEGAFGVVVKGEAMGIGGRVGIMTVAVKMLKGQSQILTFSPSVYHPHHRLFWIFHLSSMLSYHVGRFPQGKQSTFGKTLQALTRLLVNQSPSSSRLSVGIEANFWGPYALLDVNQLQIREAMLKSGNLFIGT